MRRLSGLQWVIVLLTLATAIIHFALAAGNWGTGLLPIMFALDGVGYILLIALLYFSGRSGTGRSTIRWILIFYTALTIILYFVFNGGDSFSSALGLATKAIEALLIILLLLDRGSDYEQVPAAAPATATSYQTTTRTTTALSTDPDDDEWVGTAGRSAVIGAAAATVAAEVAGDQDDVDEGAVVATRSGAVDVDTAGASVTGAFRWEGFDEDTLANLDKLDLDELRTRLEAHLASIGRLDEYQRQIEYVEGIGEVRGQKLRALEMPTALAYFARCMTRKGRREVSQESGLSEKEILTWANQIDLYRIRGVGQEYADLLEQSGVDTVVELAQRNAANLYQKMVEVNADKSLVRRLPGEKEVGDWVEQAKSLPRLIYY